MSKNTWSLLLIMVLMGITGCKTKVDLDGLDHPIGVIGHGGAGSKAGSMHLPYNTLASIQKGLDIFEADGIEVDVQMTSDHQLVLYHDRDLNKPTNCEGLIHAHTLAELQACSYSSPWYTIGAEQYPLLTLEEALSYLQTRSDSPFIVLDLKLHPDGDMAAYQQNLAEAVSRILEKYDYTHRTFIESTHTDMLEALQSTNERLQLFLYAGEAEDGIAKALEMDLTGITMNYRLLSREQVKKAREAGLMVAVFGATSQNQNRAAANLRPDYIQSDNLPFLKELLEPFNP